MSRPMRPLSRCHRRAPVGGCGGWTSTRAVSSTPWYGAACTAGWMAPLSGNPGRCRPQPLPKQPVDSLVTLMLRCILYYGLPVVTKVVLMPLTREILMADDDEATNPTLWPNMPSACY
jgi:hypothetical protein